MSMIISAVRFGTMAKSKDVKTASKTSERVIGDLLPRAPREASPSRGDHSPCSLSMRRPVRPVNQACRRRPIAMEPLVLERARILEVGSGQWRPEQHLLIEDGRIREIAARPIRAAEARRLDLAGLALLPGLCDAHVHVTAATASFPDL